MRAIGTDEVKTIRISMKGGEERTAQTNGDCERVGGIAGSRPGIERKALLHTERAIDKPCVDSGSVVSDLVFAA
jgi:hypothetical protein